MYKFPLFQSHLDLAHSYWQRLLSPTDTVIDATCGNGQDTLTLAKLCSEGTLYAIDILPRAIELSTAYLCQNLTAEQMKRIRLIQGCHSHFPAVIQPATVKLIVYNLGYLPGGGNKNLTTMVDSTLLSFQNALPLIQNGGAISIALYPGHPEGLREQEKILLFVRELSPKIWNICHHQWPNRVNSPSLLLIQKNQQ
jgi:SAM-dependent methyltransferase